MFKKRLAATAVITVLAAGAAQAQEKLKIGVLATLEGALTTLGEDALRGLEVAMRQAGRKAGGRDIEIITVATNASPDSAIRGIRKLVEQDRVPLVIGPVSGSEGIAIRDYSKTQPGVTVINGTSAAMETTYVTPSENFFRFNTNGAQWMVGVGDYIYNVKKYRKIAALAEDYSFPYTQLFGLTLEFCQLGGQDHRASLGAARHQGLRLDHRQAARRRRRDLSRPRRRRRGELPQPIHPGRRQGEDDRRLDHGRSDRAELEGWGKARLDRHADGRSAGRRPGITPNGKSG